MIAGRATRTAPRDSPRRARARRGEGERLREEILDAATRLLVETGSEEAVSIRAVADAVGVSPPSIYLHFADKTELVFAVCEEQYRRCDEYIEAAVTGAETMIDELKGRARAYVRFGLEHPEQYRILFMTRPSSTAPAFGADELMEAAAFMHVIDNVRRCREAGYLRPEADDITVATMLWSVVHGLTSLFIAKPDFPWPASPEDLLEHTLDLLDLGLLSPKGRRASQ